MRTEDFWHIVQRTSGKPGEPNSLVELTAELQRAGESTINAFERQVRRQVIALDTAELRDVAGQLWVLNDEQWLHVRAWFVSQGQEFVTGLLANPSRVLRRVADGRAGPFDPPSGEVFLYCADFARVARENVA